MKKGVDHPDHSNRTPLMYAILGNQPKMCEVMLIFGVCIIFTIGVRQCMHLSSALPHKMQVLLQCDADVNIRDCSGYTPLLWAAFQAKSEVMRVLLKYAPHTIPQKFNTIIIGLCLLYRNGADVNASDSEGRTAYHWAMKTPNLQCLKLLCKYASDDIQNHPVSDGQDENDLHCGMCILFFAQIFVADLSLACHSSSFNV